MDRLAIVVLVVAVEQFNATVLVLVEIQLRVIMVKDAAHAVEQFNVMGNAVFQLRVIMDKDAAHAVEQ